MQPPSPFAVRSRFVARALLLVSMSLATTAVAGTPQDAPAGPNAVVTEPTPLAPRFGFAVSRPEELLAMRERGTGWGEGEGRSVLVPLLDILGFNLALNLFNREFAETDEYETDLDSIQSNLESGWIIDNDPFAVNQFLHPYQGSMYHGFSRSAGLNYWEALGLDFVGSATWEVAGETGSPSLNDAITTPFGGSFLGEALFRMANLVLESDGDSPGFWPELGAAAISPSMGFNRLAFGDRFDSLYPSHEPETFARVGIGVRDNAKITDLDVVSDIQEEQVIVEFAMDYGLPGKSGYEYDRPFDYFQFEATLTSSENALPENVSTRGLLVGSKYTWGDDYRGIWGLYGTYDYVSPEVFSVSSTALAVGTTAQWSMSDAIALQGTLLGGVGWTAVGNIADAAEDRNYRYGASPQGLLALRLIFGSVAMFDLSGRDYYVSGGGSEDLSGGENIFRGQASLTVRVYGHHGLGLQFVATRRNEDFSDLSDALQTVGALSLVYTYLGDKDFGAVDWH